MGLKKNVIPSVFNDCATGLETLELRGRFDWNRSFLNLCLSETLGNFTSRVKIRSMWNFVNGIGGSRGVPVEVSENAGA